MAEIDWVKVIGYVLILIGQQMSKNEAVAKAAAKFGVSESAIWGRGGF